MYHCMANGRGKVETVTDFIFLGSKITVNSGYSHEKKKTLTPWKAMTNPDSTLKSRDITFFHIVKAMVGFSSSHVWIWELDLKEGWAQKNWCFQTVVLKKTFESPLSSKEINPVSPKGNQHWIFTERTDSEAEAPVLWPPDVKRGFFGKDTDAEKDWVEEEKGTIENKMVR